MQFFFFFNIFTEVFPAGVHWSAVGAPRGNLGLCSGAFVKRRGFDNTPQVFSQARHPLFYPDVP